MAEITMLFCRVMPVNPTPTAIEKASVPRAIATKNTVGSVIMPPKNVDMLSMLKNKTLTLLLNKT
mgnify:CR=1 FL=1